MDNFAEVKAKGEEIYKSLTEVYCPYFKEVVVFNSQALEHLKFKQRGKARNERDQFMRFKLIHLAPEILKISSSLQGIWETKKFVPLKINKKWVNSLANIKYYEFIAVVQKNRVKIIVKQIEGERKIFWSIIPFWGMNKKTMTRLLHDGNPEDD